MVLASRPAGGQPDPVAIQHQVHVNAVPNLGRAEDLAKPERLVEARRPLQTSVKSTTWGVRNIQEGSTMQIAADPAGTRQTLLAGTEEQRRRQLLPVTDS